MERISIKEIANVTGSSPYHIRLALAGLMPMGADADGNYCYDRAKAIKALKKRCATEISVYESILQEWRTLLEGVDKL